MKAKQPLRRFGVNDVTAPTLTAERANRTSVSRTANHVSLVCPVCGIGFTRKAAEAKRHTVSYCCKACAGFAYRKQIEVECRVCGKPFTVKKSYVGHVTCCGEECSSKAKSGKVVGINYAKTT